MAYWELKHERDGARFDHQDEYRRTTSEQAAPNNKAPYNVFLSFCDGMGGAGVAAQFLDRDDNWFPNLYAHHAWEVDSACIEVTGERFLSGKARSKMRVSGDVDTRLIHEGGLDNLSEARLDAIIAMYPPDTRFVVVAGPPCQDVSSAGKQAGATGGERSVLVFLCADAIAYVAVPLLLLLCPPATTTTTNSLTACVSGTCSRSSRSGLSSSSRTWPPCPRPTRPSTPGCSAGRRCCWTAATSARSPGNGSTLPTWPCSSRSTRGTWSRRCCSTTTTTTTTPTCYCYHYQLSHHAPLRWGKCHSGFGADGAPRAYWARGRNGMPSRHPNDYLAPGWSFPRDYFDCFTTNPNSFDSEKRNKVQNMLDPAQWRVLSPEERELMLLFLPGYTKVANVSEAARYKVRVQLRPPTTDSNPPPPQMTGNTFHVGHIAWILDT